MSFHGLLRVLVVDDHAGIRAGLKSLVNAEHPRMGCVGIAGSASEALAQTRALRPDVIVLDVNLDGEDGLSLIPAIHRLTPCAVIVLTSLFDPMVTTSALTLGAFACLHKTAPAGDLLATILSAGSHINGLLAATPSIEGGSLSQVGGTNHPVERGNSADGAAWAAA